MLQWFIRFKRICRIYRMHLHSGKTQMLKNDIYRSWKTVHCGLLVLSLLVCMYWPSKTTTPSQSEIFSLCWFTSKKLDRIFHFGRVCWSWKANTYIPAERATALRQNISDQYIHTSKEREKQVDFMPFNCEEDHVVYGLPFQNSEMLLRPSQRSLKARQTLCVWLDSYNSS